MALSNIFGWNKEEEKKAVAACGTACGAGDKEEKPAACGTACGAGDKEEKLPHYHILQRGHYGMPESDGQQSSKCIYRSSEGCMDLSDGEVSGI